MYSNFTYSRALKRVSSSSSPRPRRAFIHSFIHLPRQNRNRYDVNAPTPPKRSISRSTAIQPPQSGVNRSLSPRARPQMRRCLANDSPVEPNRFRAFAFACVVAPRRHPPTRARGGATWCVCVCVFTMYARWSFEWASMSTSNRAWINVVTCMGGQVATFIKIAKWQHWNVRRPTTLRLQYVRVCVTNK